MPAREAVGARPITIRVTTEVTLPTANSAPAERADMPDDMTVSIISASGARPADAGEGAVGARSRAWPLEAGSSASASAAHATNAQRQSTSTTNGTANPHSSVAIGFPASLIPNATPCRCAGTLSATVALAASWATPLTVPVARSRTTSTANEPVAAAIAPATTAVASAAIRRLVTAPSRSTTRPSRAENSDCEMKQADSARPSAAGPIPRSERICGPSAPAR